MITLTAAVPFGTESVDVVVEAERASVFSVEGLPEASAREVKVRFLSACNHLDRRGWLPRVRIVVRDRPFPTAALDLTVAIAALAAEDNLPLPATPPTLHGELGLDGKLRPVRGLYAALRRGGTAIVPARQEHEASLSRSSCFAAAHLSDVVRLFKNLPAVPPAITRREPEILPYEAPPRDAEFESPVGEAVLLIAKPGSGALRLARQIASDLASPTDVEDILSIYSVGGIFPDDPLVPFRVPFRAPHHTVSEAGLLGGGICSRPGEVSLAHGGCLLLDDVAEFRRSSLEALAKVLRDGHADVGTGKRASFPAKPQLVVGTCRPEDAARARKLFSWTSEVAL